MPDHSKSIYDLNTRPRGEDYLSLVRRLEDHGITCYHTKWAPEYLSTIPIGRGFLIDVGVNFGTPELYPCFEGKTVICVDPVDTHFEAIQRNYPAIDFIFINAAAGKKRARSSLNIAAESGHNSLHERSSQPRDGIKLLSSPVQKVEIRKLDKLVTDVGLRNQGTLKIDVEGHEMEVLRGARRTLKKVTTVIVELSIRDLYEHSYKFVDVLRFLDRHGFRLYEILNSKGRPPAFYDCVFMRDDPKIFSASSDR